MPLMKTPADCCHTKRQKWRKKTEDRRKLGTKSKNRWPSKFGGSLKSRVCRVGEESAWAWNSAVALKRVKFWRHLKNTHECCLEPEEEAHLVSRLLAIRLLLLVLVLLLSLLWLLCLNMQGTVNNVKMSLYCFTLCWQWGRKMTFQMRVLKKMFRKHGALRNLPLFG